MRNINDVYVIIKDGRVMCALSSSEDARNAHKLFPGEKIRIEQVCLLDPVGYQSKLMRVFEFSDN